jgi:hypothetical protein
VTAGTYVLTARATDNLGKTAVSLPVTVVVNPSQQTFTLDIPVAIGTDDAEEKSSGSVTRASSDLELVTDGSTVQTVGLRFQSVSIPPGAVIANAYVQFRVDEASSGATSLTVQGQAADDTATFTSAKKNISSRPRTAAAVGWTPVPWPTRKVSGPDQRTPNLAPILQEIVSRPGWASGRSLALIVSGTGKRSTEGPDRPAARQRPSLPSGCRMMDGQRPGRRGERPVREHDR